MATNSFGLDAAYFSDKLSLVLRDLGHFTPEELARALARMARTACEGVLGEAEFTVLAAPPAAEQPAAGHELFAELYQILGELGASEAVLDQVLAASQGDPLPHASLLPYAAGQPDTVRVPVETLRRHADHLQTAGYNNAADDLRALLAGGAE